TRRRYVVAGDHVEECGLARAVRTDERDDRPARDVEVHVVHSQQATEPLGDAARADEHGVVRHGPGPDVDDLGRVHWSRASSVVSASRAPLPVSDWPCGAMSTLSVSTSTPISRSASCNPWTVS